MVIMLFSLFFSGLGWYLGSKIGADFWVILFSMVGFFFPPFFVLEKIEVNQDKKRRVNKSLLFLIY